MAERWRDRLTWQPRGAQRRWLLQAPAWARDGLRAASGVSGAGVGPAGPWTPGETLWLQLGPEEAWLLSPALGAGPSGPPASLEAALADVASRGDASACVDLSDAWVGWDLIGEGAAGCLAQGCSLDFERWNDSGCARTRIAQAPAVLAPWAADGHHPPGIRLWTERSHTAYLVSWLRLALDGRP